MPPKLVLHLCAALCLSLAACSDPRPPPPEVSPTVIAEGTLEIEGDEPRPYHDVRFGDLVLRELGDAKRFKEGNELILMVPDYDPRFSGGDPDILENVSFSILNKRNDPPRTIDLYLPDFNALTRDLQPEPGLYDAPPTITVFRDPRVEYLRIVVRVDGTTFFGRQVYMLCRGMFHAQGRQCDFYAWISDETYVWDMLFHSRHPPEEWPAYVESIEAGLRKMIVPQ